MTQPTGAGQPPTTLENCDREPIHIPGAIQSHGALLALDMHGTVQHASSNLADLLGDAVPLAQDVQTSPLLARHAELRALVQEGLAALVDHADVPMPAEWAANGRAFDVVMHLSHGLLVIEFELRHASEGELASFAVRAHRAMEKLRRPRANINELLQLAAQELRALTGFDRVMAYRFRHDHSGEVVGEARADFLDAYLGRRYPASDIPAQARALYVANTLRLIADVQSPTVPLRQNGAQPPLDLSASILRSVSPIHIEYLGNMGVGASMSVSIVINNTLWGLIACHHMAPRQVPYSVRMACDVIAQILGSSIQAALSRSLAERQLQAAALRTRVLESVLHSDDEFAALCTHAAALGRELRAGAVVVAEHGKLCVEGELPEAAARALIEWLNASQGGDAVYATHSLPGVAPHLADALMPWCGVLALPLYAGRGAWLVFLRKEQLETIHWGGKPEKDIRPGPLGPRLTPRGSFELWKETVHLTAEHWSADDEAMARELLDELRRAQHTRDAELHTARSQLMAMLGHDLRDPLHSISMAARMLEKSAPDDGSNASAQAGRLGQRIQSSSGRMQRLISQVMDMSRLQSRLGLDLALRDVDLVQLLNDLMDEARTAHPHTQLVGVLPAAQAVRADPDRMAQVLTNLISNARHHGETGHPVEIRLHGSAHEVRIEVRNVSAPIAADIADQMFSPFKSTSLGNTRNRSGLGLGLYIASEIVKGHGGTIGYAYDAPHVVFEVRLHNGATPAGPG
ncbi:ATP-binding protein [Paracidovorax sp. MALMAid1276]|uniref:ATP-binding protein n=1 Tax=Paracidovorax sp. MALMAid1276 TaxID=3411631 RepID=UPI003B9BED64